jgi:hypothetical protein
VGNDVLMQEGHIQFHRMPVLGLKREEEMESISHKQQKQSTLVLLHNMSAHKFYCFETNISMLSNEV